MKIFLRILSVLFVLLVLSGFGAWYYLQSDSPDYTGQYTLSDLDGQVEIVFDQYAVPHIYASGERDAYFALGFVHASERLFQMEMIRRAASGRLAEVIGPDLIPTDILFRTVGLSDISQQSVAAYHSTQTQGYQIAAQAYLDGINAFIAEGDDPIEFGIMGIEKAPFSMKDLYDVSGFMAYGFASGLKQEPIVERFAQRLGPDYLADWDLQYDGSSQRIHSFRDTSLAMTEQSFSPRIHAALDKLPVPLLQGSNSWVIGPSRSASGKVLFANDPHIGFGQPSVWYEAHLNAPDFSWYGYHLAAYPFSPVGHNEHHAIGLTMFLNDDTQFYREKVNPDNPDQVWFKDHWEDLEIIEQTIKVKGAPDTLIRVRRSRHGPIINDAFKEVQSEAPIALWWIYLQQANNLMIPAYELGHGRSLQELESAAAKIIAPGLNVMYGDIDGNIASWSSAKLARFPSHVNPRIYLDGSSGEDELLGYYDFADNPKSVNPPWGYVYSANNQHDSLPGGYYPGYYAAEHRSKRIVQLLERRDDWEAEGVKDMLLDHTGPNLQAIVKSLLADMTSETRPDARERLAAWDGSHPADAIAPTIYYKLLYYTLRFQLADELGLEDFSSIVNTYLLQNSLDRLLPNPQSIWWDNIHTEAKEGRADAVNAAWERTIQELTAQFGDDLSAWRWDKAHYLDFQHPLGAVPPLDKIFNVGPIPAASGNEVINNLAFDLDSTGLYPSTFGPSRRAVIDFADPARSWSILPSGNSGHVGSEHYDDQVQMYARGEFRAQLLDRTDIESQAKGRWTLIPQ
ncbi:MAG: penicillin acylase family protein [Bacteroidota bacterium]